MSAWNLSKKEKYLGTGKNEEDCIYKKKDIKEFIRLDMELIISLVEERITWQQFYKRRKKLVGEGLI